MGAPDIDPVAKAGMVGIFARWQRAACEFQYQTRIRDEAAKRADEAAASINACREACKAFGIDPDNTDQFGLAFHAYGAEAALLYNQTKPEHLPAWYIEPPAPQADPITDANRIPTQSLETPPPPPMPRIKDIILEYLQITHDLELGGTKAAVIRSYIEGKYLTTIHEKTVGMTLYRLLKDGKVRRQGHNWFFIPQAEETKNPGAPTPRLFEGR